jgi:hypothetical protein
VGGEWRYKSGEQGCSSALTPGDTLRRLRRALRRLTKIRQGYAFLFPSLPILLPLLGALVFGSDHDFTNSIFLQQLLHPCPMLGPPLADARDFSIAVLIES